MRAEVVLGDPFRLKATSGAGVEVIAVAERAVRLGTTGVPVRSNGPKTELVSELVCVRSRRNIRLLFFLFRLGEGTRMSAKAFDLLEIS
jgi:hypothetical protein